MGRGGGWLRLLVALCITAATALLSVGSSAAPAMHEVPFVALHPEHSARLRHHLAHIQDGMRAGLISLMQFLEQQGKRLTALNEQYPQLRELHEEILDTHAQVPVFWERNEQLLYHLLAPFSFRQCLPSPDEEREAGFELPPRNSSYASEQTGYESVSQVLHHLMRDYSERAAETRRELHEPILAYLRKHLPAVPERRDADVSNREALRKILVPGAGMGRLALEIAAHTPHDIAVEANECSYTMIAAMRNVFNQLLLPDAEAATVYPNLQATGMDDLSHHDRLQGYTIPDAQAKQLVEDNAVRRKISVEFGDFVAIYGSPFRHVAYHAVVTCFFIDTATNVLEYLGIIGHLLSRHGGVWINAGPLHYHSESAVRYSLEALDAVISRSGFTLLEHTQVTTTYCGEEQVSMKPEVYQVPIQVWRLTDPSKVLPLPRTSYATFHT